MMQILRYGIDISEHSDHKGVYECTIGKYRKPSRNTNAEIICTLRRGKEDSIGLDNGTETAEKFSPIVLSYRGTHVTLRPWDPYDCMIAAGIRHKLIHWQIRPGHGVLALGCSLRSLSHIVDILGSEGRLIGVIDAEGERPSSNELRAFFKSNPGASLVFAPIRSASFETYERWLSLPLSSKYAFLMALHPRLGAESPARKLLEAEETTKLVRHVFSFLQGGDAPDVTCLVVFHWPPSMSIEDSRSVVLSHVSILQQWRASRKMDEQANRAAESESDDPEDTTEKETEEKATTATDTQAESSKRKPKDKPESSKIRVLMHIPTDGQNVKEKGKQADQAIAELKTFPDGRKTGLVGKEWLCLAPYFTSDSLVVLKSRTTKKAPSSGHVPVPAFAAKFGASFGAPPAAPSAPRVPAAPAAPAPSSASKPAPTPAASSSSKAVSSLVQQSGRDAPKAKKGKDRSVTWMDSQGKEAQDLRISLPPDPTVATFAGGGLTGAVDFRGASSSGTALDAVQEIGLRAQQHAASPPLGAGAALMRGGGRGRGACAADSARGPAAMVPGRPPMMQHSNVPGPVTPGPLEHFGAGLGAVDPAPAPCMGDPAQMWGLQPVGPPGLMAPPGLGGEGYGPEPVNIGPGARGGWGQPSYAHLGGGKGAGGPNPGAFGKGHGNMVMGGWREAPGANGQGGVAPPPPSGSAPPHIDQLQYMGFSF